MSNILLLIDDPTERGQITGSLFQAGHSVTVVPSPAVLLALLHPGAWDLLITDGRHDLAREVASAGLAALDVGGAAADATVLEALVAARLARLCAGPA